ncbi:group I intron-associated PD-(D/E)XK endonuclease [Tsukamurella sp. NPDC003166]|uniref:group I intron-associated PD-(D/E)XK endonuclease n=1 Tax=Tsukamurella sp. NPDC003166 TaxID=3154444 RepID=UPI0033ABB8F6
MPGSLARAGSMLAAAWFTLRGHEVSWPLEPSRYDLLVCRDERVVRVQVKTTVSQVRGTWKVYLSTCRQGRLPYRADEIDEFFIIDGEFGCFRIPIGAVEGLQAIHLSAYADYRVEGFDGAAIAPAGGVLG